MRSAAAVPSHRLPNKQMDDLDKQITTLVADIERYRKKLADAERDGDENSELQLLSTISSSQLRLLTLLNRQSGNYLFLNW